MRAALAAQLDLGPRHRRPAACPSCSRVPVCADDAAADAGQRWGASPRVRSPASRSRTSRLRRGGGGGWLPATNLGSRAGGAPARRRCAAAAWRPPGAAAASRDQRLLELQIASPPGRRRRGPARPGSTPAPGRARRQVIIVRPERVHDAWLTGPRRQATVLGSAVAVIALHVLVTRNVLDRMAEFATPQAMPPRIQAATRNGTGPAAGGGAGGRGAAEAAPACATHAAPLPAGGGRRRRGIGTAASLAADRRPRRAAQSHHAAGGRGCGTRRWRGCVGSGGCHRRRVGAGRAGSDWPVSTRLTYDPDRRYRGEINRRRAGRVGPRRQPLPGPHRRLARPADHAAPNVQPGRTRRRPPSSEPLRRGDAGPGCASRAG